MPTALGADVGWITVAATHNFFFLPMWVEPWRRPPHHDAKTDAAEEVARIVPEAARGATEPRLVVPGAAAENAGSLK